MLRRRSGRLPIILAPAICMAAASWLLAAESRRTTSLFSSAEFARHVQYLASDDLQGRGVGTAGIDAAADYLAREFKALGVEPFGDKGTYFQSFEVSIRSRIGDSTRLEFAAPAPEGPVTARLEREFVPFPFSKSAAFAGPIVFVGYGIEEEERQYSDYDGVDVKGKVALVLRHQPEWWNAEQVDEQATGVQSFGRHAYFMTKAGKAAEHGAAAVLIVNPVPPDDGRDDILYNFESGRAATVDIPMLHITRALADRLLKAGGLESVAALQKQIESTKKPGSRPLNNVSVTGAVALEPVKEPARNVVGVIRGRGPHKDEFVVVGAHYDHLGVTTNFRAPKDRTRHIHNGADDNASGTAGLLMMAQAFHEQKPPDRSIILIAFTAEESGLLGSKHWVKNAPIPLQKIVAMLNMDMIGRLRDEQLEIGGVGTGEGFRELIDGLAKTHAFNVRSGGGGRGPSDHSSFYGEGIPVLFFFTGLHKQYHAPDDDVPLLNLDGACRVAELVFDCATAIADADGRPTFRKDTTRVRPFSQDEDERVAAAGKPDPHGGAHGAGDEERASMPRVRMGIAPGNYGPAEEKRGFPIEYVSEGGPAAKAGLQDRDRILTIDGKPINDVYSFMSVLSTHKPGDEVKVVVARGEKELSFQVKLEASAASGRS